MSLSTPRWWYVRTGAPAPITRMLLRPLSWIWAFFTERRIRNAKPGDAGIPVICVGNLTMGGAGKTPGEVRYIDVKKNVFALGIANNAEYGLISGSNFDLKGDNLIKADTDNPNNSRSWWVSAMGCSEALGNLTVNNGSCGWEASNCFGQGLSGPRYLFVYVGK